MLLCEKLMDLLIYDYVGRTFVLNELSDCHLKLNLLLCQWWVAVGLH